VCTGQYGVFVYLVYLIVIIIIIDDESGMTMMRPVATPYKLFDWQLRYLDIYLFCVYI